MEGEKSSWKGLPSLQEEAVATDSFSAVASRHHNLFDAETTPELDTTI